MKSNDELRREILLSLDYSETQIEEIIQELSNYVPSMPYRILCNGT